MSAIRKHILLIPALDVRHYHAVDFPRGEKWQRSADRMPAALGWMLDQLRGYAAHATVGLFGQTAERMPELAKAIEAAGCELAAMTYDKIDPWSLSPGILREQVEASVEAFAKAVRRRPTTFMPPFPNNHEIDLAQATALREAGMEIAAGCKSLHIDTVPLAVFGGHELCGRFMRYMPALVVRRALSQVSMTACCITTMDIDPGPAELGGGRNATFHRFPKLLRKGFLSVREAQA